jgi:hypothetical protein
MKQLKARILRLPSLVMLSLLGVGLSVAAIFPVSHHIREVSVSVADNFEKLALFMGLLLLSSVPLMLLVARLAWGPNAFADGASATGDLESDAGHLKVTGSKLGFIYGVLLIANALVFDTIGGGVLVFQTRRWGVLAELRSADAASRRSGADSSVHFTGDREFTRSLGRILDNPGAGREWAALAAGARKDRELADSLVALAAEGTAVERAASVGALARIRDPRVVRAVIAAWPHLGEHQVDAFLALALIGKNEDVLSRKDLEDAGAFIMDQVDAGTLSRELTHVAIFALNRLESPLGLVWLEGLLSTEQDVQTLCMALEALGNIGAADSSPRMIAFLDGLKPEDQCQEAVVLDFARRQTLIRTNASLVARTIVEIARIGDSRALNDMARISRDDRYPASIRAMAAEIAFKLQFRAGGAPQ